MMKLSLYTKIKLLSISLGIAYFWFGILKFFPGLSPAETLAKDTIDILVLGLIPSNISIILLAIWEIVIGVCLIFNVFKRIAVIIALVHMACTFTPFFVLPASSYHETPIHLTLVGQYIIKNLAFVCALLIIYPDREE